MVQSCSRERARLRSHSESSSDLTVALSGSTIAVACLACVVWTLTNDHAVESELASEGASQVIEPAAPPALCPVPSGTMPVTGLRIDDGRYAAEKPVVNAHLEIVTGEDDSQVVDVSSMVRQLGFGAPRRSEGTQNSVGAWLTGRVESDGPDSRDACRPATSATR